MSASPSSSPVPKNSDRADNNFCQRDPPRRSSLPGYEPLRAHKRDMKRRNAFMRNASDHIRMPSTKLKPNIRNFHWLI
ncbi:hypothetical protein C5748_00220 [Phyllobacterium phragmitis]|uniref:Uncharacterized protein n=1 Tax=Phyllobacterium phragmitis TaxID=2670329 RepID=A0A2S9IYN3_9HYPH|nr:hypothetical protein C5748_00220 [Phyllobacterium phragmitis]